MDPLAVVGRAIAQIETESAGVSVDSRRGISDALRRLATKLDTPRDAVFQILQAPYQLALSRIGLDLKLFQLLVETAKPMYAQDMQSHLGGDLSLIRRLCKAMASWRIIDEIDQDLFAASHVTACLVQPDFSAAVATHFYIFNEVFQALPDHLAATEYKEPVDRGDNAFSRAFDTDLGLLEWLEKHPFEAENFLQFIRLVEQAGIKWTSVVPFAQLTSDWQGDRPLFVSVGSRTGLQTLEFQQVASGIPGRIICQDVPMFLSAIPETDGIEKMQADILEEQPVKGAKFYYLRHVLHHRVDSDCVKLLRHVKEAMAPDSLVLIDETVMPEKSVPCAVAGYDIGTLSMFGGKERTRSEWQELLEKRAGLSIQEIRLYEPFLGNSVIVCVP